MRTAARLLRRLRIKWVWLAAAVLAGAFLHIATVLAVNQMTPHRGIQTLALAGQVNNMTVLPPVTASFQPLPFLSPDTRYAVCRFDLNKGPVVIHATLGDDNWTVALYAPSGANVYAVAGADLEQRDVELLLAVSQDTQGAALPIAHDASSTTITVGMPSRTGVAIISAPMTSTADADKTARLLTQAACTARIRADGATN